MKVRGAVVASDRDEALGVEIAGGRQAVPHRHHRVRHRGMGAIEIDLRRHRHRAHAHAPARAQDTDGDLTTVGDEDGAGGTHRRVRVSRTRETDKATC